MSLLTLAGLALLVSVVASLPAYALLGRRRPVDADVASRPTSALLGPWVRDWVMWVIAPLEHALVRSGISPDALNLAGAAGGLAAGIAYAYGALAAGGALILLGGLADILDGRVARARGLVSAYGEFLDSVLDRFSETFAFAGIAVYFAPRAGAVFATALALGGSMLVSYTRAKAKVVGVEARGGLMQRAERLVLLAVASLADAPLCHAAHWPAGTVLLGAIVVIGVGSMTTAVGRSLATARALRPPRR
jgi:phosphatidylglycerophosphate synthase